MHKYTFITSNGKTWQRITKKQAREAYNNGLTVLFCPVNKRPFWWCGLDIEMNKNDEGAALLTFDEQIELFESFNCFDNETGRYAAFYIPIVTVDIFTGEAPTENTLETVTQYDYSVLEV